MRLGNMACPRKGISMNAPDLETSHHGMHSLVNDLWPRIRAWVEIDYSKGLGLHQSGDLFEIAASEAAARLVYHWDDQFVTLAPSVIANDVAEVIAHLVRWRDELIANLPEVQ